MKNWVGKAFNPKNRGKLHRELKVPQGEKIPLRRLKSAKKKGGALGRRAALAITARGFDH